MTLRKLLRIDSVIFVNLYERSFLRLFLNIYKKYFIYLKTYTQSNFQPSTCFAKRYLRKSISTDHNNYTMAFPYLILTSLFHFLNFELEMLMIRCFRHTDPETEKSQELTLFDSILTRFSKANFKIYKSKHSK